MEPVGQPGDLPADSAATAAALPTDIKAAGRVAVLLLAWQRSMAELEASLTSEFPTPVDLLDRPIGDAGKL